VVVLNGARAPHGSLILPMRFNAGSILVSSCAKESIRCGFLNVALSVLRKPTRTPWLGFLSAVSPRLQTDASICTRLLGAFYLRESGSYSCVKQHFGRRRPVLPTPQDQTCGVLRTLFRTTWTSLRRLSFVTRITDSLVWAFVVPIVHEFFVGWVD
jgi:hypothetical protein